MPWCGPCQWYFAPPALNADGTCPACGEAVDMADVAQGIAEEGEAPEEDVRAPWHFWAVVVATVVYVGWRIVQLVAGGVGI